METVQLPCNHCGELMAVSVEHMGMQVHCPHCQGVVQVPAAEVMTDKTWLDKPDDPVQKTAEDTTIREEAPKTIQASDVTAADLFRDVPLRPPARKEPAHEPAWTDAAGDKEDNELPAVPHIQRPRPSVLVPILLLFLIPYSLAMTGWVAFLIYRSHQNQANSFDPLERLPDPKPGDGGPRQVTHDLEVPAQLKTHLQHAVRVGDLEVTPTKVEWTKKGDIVLVMKMRNVSSDVEFCPMIDDFSNFKDGKLRPYTFLQSIGRSGDRLYGGSLKVVEDGKEKKIDPAHRLRPNHETTIRLTTREPDRKRADLMKKNPQDVIWRVQVRRGFLATREGPKSATAVVGVQFHTSAIEE